MIPRITTQQGVHVVGHDSASLMPAKVRIDSTLHIPSKYEMEVSSAPED